MEESRSTPSIVKSRETLVVHPSFNRPGTWPTADMDELRSYFLRLGGRCRGSVVQIPAMGFGGDCPTVSSSRLLPLRRTPHAAPQPSSVRGMQNSGVATGSMGGEQRRLPR